MVRSVTQAACKTTSGAVVGTSVAKVGSSRNSKLQLRCKVGQRLIAPSGLPKAYGGAVYCKQGSMVVLANGTRGFVNVTWYAPGQGKYKEYKKVQKFRF